MRLFLIFIIVFLSSCNHKTDFVRNAESHGYPKFNKIMLVVDYVHLVDDVGTYFDFDENVNTNFNNKYYQAVKNHLNTLGYEVLEERLQSSGLYMNNQWLVEHYKGKQLQADLISPPFFAKSFLLEDQEIESVLHLSKELLSTLDPAIVDRGDRSQRYLNSLKFPEFTKLLEIPDASAILLILLSKERVSAMKGLGMALISAAVSQNSSVNVGLYGNFDNGMAHAFLIEKTSGKLIWTNYKNSTPPPGSIKLLLKNFPENHIEK